MLPAISGLPHHWTRALMQSQSTSIIKGPPQRAASGLACRFHLLSGVVLLRPIWNTGGREGGKKMLRIGGGRFLGLKGVLAPGSAARLYHERVVDHFDNPRNVGSFDKNDPTVGTGLVGAPACGDVMKLQIRVDETSGKIVDACFKTFGCGSAIASSSVATEWVKGKQMVEVLTIKNTEIAKHLSLPPVKLHCSMLAEDAIKAAVKDYEAKRAKSGSVDKAVEA